MSTLFSSQIASAGFTRAPMTSIIAELNTLWQSVFGADIDIDPRSPDGQLIGGIAEMLDDLNGIAYDTYQGIANPNAATWTMLSALMALTGVPRKPASYSSAPATFTGANGTVIPITSVVRSTLDATLWSPIAEITIGGTGTATGTLRCQTIGPAASGTVPAATLTEIVTPITTPGDGWTAVTNAIGVSGYLVEGDPNGRIRRQQSVAIASQAMTDGMQAALKALTGVLDCVVYENNLPQAVSSPGVIAANSIRAILKVTPGGAADPAESGDDDDPVANLIFTLKGNGCGTVGTTTKNPADSTGKAHPINYDLATATDVMIRITVASRYNWPSDGATQIEDAITAWAAGTNADTGKPNIAIGGDDNGTLSWTDVVASFINSVPGFDLTLLEFSADAGSNWTTSPASLVIPFGTYANITDVTVTVT